MLKSEEKNINNVNYTLLFTFHFFLFTPFC